MDQFRAALAARGIVVPHSIIADGSIHRCDAAGKNGKGDAACIAEGYATGASIHAATGYTVAVAFNAGNLGQVATAIRQTHPETRLIVCADDDADPPGNPGLMRARDAARATGAFVAVPAFGADRPTGATDFNDLHQARGLEVVADSIAAAIASAGGDVGSGSSLLPTGRPTPPAKQQGQAVFKLATRFAVASCKSFQCVYATVRSVLSRDRVLPPSVKATEA